MYLLIPAAGMGRRMGSEFAARRLRQRNKLLLKLLEKPLLAWTLLAAEQSQTIRWIGIMGQPMDFPDFKDILNQSNLTKPVELIAGGDTRQESVYNGLQALPDAAERVLIHDGARCLVTPKLFDRCSNALNDCQSFIAAVPVKDTIKVVDSRRIITDTPERSNLWAAQTPQGFDVALLKKCHAQGKNLGWQVTDDAALLEKCDIPVKIVEGEETNLKVTTPVDLAIAEFILRQRINS
ncbi:2-C-methyl-D-erythritol 4-phosphate cytidylyltransferase [Waterburya agarophytonicola K14]|uniref:2-C-methyl-D-erythritol 4-phosphate cytidylyltransferase n=1 Tax=Waterburya agarophytonicola KI4 TaxID=2874699 RepID=A0A964FFI4_9CYAN|nr:2-C-methyl-D-erythritol 4-phosphate cytidylyltransferase [Waterburya agarophytonicola]MCC0176951.1 2-C-methyl-D-erythritol 4-phosphate cytidylyltransferase [Waterburya agarophytonicola KI4]